MRFWLLAFGVSHHLPFSRWFRLYGAFGVWRLVIGQQSTGNLIPKPVTILKTSIFIV
jgi:hypothetical protein